MIKNKADPSSCASHRSLRSLRSKLQSITLGFESESANSNLADVSIRLFHPDWNKKGFLLGEFTLKTIIAIFSIILLIYLLVNIYSSFQEKSKIDQAKASLERINENVFSVSQSGVEKLFVLTSPKDWIFTYFGSDNLKPKFCQGRNCLCICEKEGYFSNQLEKCESKGFCNIAENKIIFESDIVISSTDIIIKKEDSGIRIRGK